MLILTVFCLVVVWLTSFQVCTCSPLSHNDLSYDGSFEAFNTSFQVSHPRLDPKDVRCYGRAPGKPRVTYFFCKALLEWIESLPGGGSIVYKGTTRFRIPGCDCVALLSSDDQVTELRLSDEELSELLFSVMRTCEVGLMCPGLQSIIMMINSGLTSVYRKFPV